MGFKIFGVSIWKIFGAENINKLRVKFVSGLFQLILSFNVSRQSPTDTYV